MDFQETPLTSRSRFLRGRKRVTPHPISQLQKKEPKKTKPKDVPEPPRDFKEPRELYVRRKRVSLRIEAINRIAKAKEIPKPRRHSQRLTDK